MCKPYGIKSVGCAVEMIQIKNDCTDAPLGLEWHVRRSLGWYDPTNLDGLGFIWLLDEMPELTSKAPELLKTAKEQGLGVYGLYCPRQDNTSAHIMLFIRDIYRGIPSFYWWSAIPTLRINRTLAHEVGHHLDAKRGYILQPKEECTNKETLANQYAEHIRKKMMNKWYYRLGQWELNNIAMVHYTSGMRSWSEKRYKDAAEHWYTAWDLNPELKEAAYWYWRAKNLFDAESNGCLFTNT
jgi:hypothetical protein